MPRHAMTDSAPPRLDLNEPVERKSPTLARSIRDGSTQTTEAPATSQPPAAAKPPFEERLASLEVTRLKSEIAGMLKQREKERAEAPTKEDLDAALAERDEARQSAASLAAALDEARQATAAREADLAAAMQSVAEAQKLTQQRSAECSQWRAESARAVGRLEALTDAYERQQQHGALVEKELAATREALRASRDLGEVVHQPLRPPSLSLSEMHGMSGALTPTSSPDFGAHRAGAAMRAR